MKFAVDIDDTVTEWPNEFKAIMESLMSCGHEVYMLTGALDSMSASEKYRERQLLELGISRGTHYDGIQICISDSLEGVAKLKGQFCKEKEINAFFDDRELYLDGAKYQSPQTLRLRVMP